MSILDKEIQFCFDSYLEYNFYRVWAFICAMGQVLIEAN